MDATVESLAEEYKVPVTLAADIHEAAVSESIDPKMAFGLVRAESRFRPTIVSPVGAVGLTQVMPATARWLMPGTTKADLRDPETNLKVGFKYLRSLLNQFEGNEKLALTAYNRGPGTVSKILNRGGDPDNGYAEMVMTGKSSKHVRLMNAKFGAKHKVTKAHPAKNKASAKHKSTRARG
jgi:soluble lytic murein transglycosylase-like protein